MWVIISSLYLLVAYYIWSFKPKNTFKVRKWQLKAIGWPIYMLLVMCKLIARAVANNS